MRQTYWVVDAFTDTLFTGNPAAVLLPEAPLPDRLMQQIAAENNLSETAFAVPEDDGYRLRWFTPTVEVDLCGHATLATCFVLAGQGHTGPFRFHTRSGLLTASISPAPQSSTQAARYSCPIWRSVGESHAYRRAFCRAI